MGKNKRRQLLAEDTVHNQLLSVDSTEEKDLLNWLCEAHELGIIIDFSYQPSSFKLFDSVRYQDVDNKTRSLFREHSYSPDFVVEFNPNENMQLAKEFKIQYSELSNSNCSAYVDCKGTFNKTERAFGYNLKWVWQKFKTYIYKLVPKVFFAKFGVPQKCKLTEKTKKPRTMFNGLSSMQEMLSIR